MTEVDFQMRRAADDSKVGDHAVRHLVRPGDLIRTEYRCTAGPDAPCRTFCQTCWDEAQERCVCDDSDRKPVLTGGHPCNYLSWIENGEPEWAYNGPEEPVRGPGWQPIVFHWEGDDYSWRYRDER